MPVLPTYPRLAILAGLGCAFAAPLAATAQTFAIEEATIQSLHEALAAGTTTCHDVVAGYLARIEAYDDQGPSLNAIITVNPAAIETADEMDALYAATPAAVGPLHCVPVILKDNYDTADLPTSGGVIALAESVPAEDAFIVAQLREAGAIILAKANLTELAMGGNSVSSLGGQTLNPYDLTRTPGGSSGGTGSAIAASFGIVGTGSDTGQSVRSPASANGLVGIRATRGLVSRAGIIPLSITQDEAGPITRTVADAAAMLDAMAGYDPADPITAGSVGHVPETYTAFLDPNALDGARIGVLRDIIGGGPEHAEVNRVTDLAIDAMTGLGAEMIDVSMPNFAELSSGMGTSNYELPTALGAYFANLGPDVPIHSLAELVADGRYGDPVAESLVEANAGTNTMTDPDYLAVFQKRDEFQKALLVLMAEYELDAILYPHQRVLVAKVGESQAQRNGVVSNASGFPAITFAGGFSAPDADAPVGVPIGIELLGRPWSEGQLIGYAYAFEQATKLRVPPASTPPLASVAAAP